MPRYFFDFEDGQTLSRDPEGLDLPDKEAARRAAIGELTEIVREEFPDADTREFVVTVRDGKDTIIFRAELRLRGYWVAQDR